MSWTRVSHIPINAWRLFPAAFAQTTKVWVGLVGRTFPPWMKTIMLILFHITELWKHRWQCQMQALQLAWYYSSVSLLSGGVRCMSSSHTSRQPCTLCCTHKEDVFLGSAEDLESLSHLMAQVHNFWPDECYTAHEGLSCNSWKLL